MASPSKPKAWPKGKAMKEKSLPNLVLHCNVPFEGLPFGKVTFLNCVDYNIRDPHYFREF
jgi:hypothetical protein